LCRNIGNAFAIHTLLRGKKGVPLCSSLSTLTPGNGSLSIHSRSRNASRVHLRIRVYRPRPVGELCAVLGDAIRSWELRLIDVLVDPTVNRALVDKLARYWYGKK
jgi:hypothetical protein